jgi:hypothetical protein
MPAQGLVIEDVMSYWTQVFVEFFNRHPDALK